MTPRTVCNGLRYCQIYGFPIKMGVDGPTAGMWRDEFHQDETKAMDGARVQGMWIAKPWLWDGKVKKFQYDASWDYQNDPPVPGYKWWNSSEHEEGCKKTEHKSPDPRSGKPAFIQSSTAG